MALTLRLGCVSPLAVVAYMMAVAFVLGTFMEWVPISFITVPIVASVAAALWVDTVWFGVRFTMNIQICYLSPPFGPARFFLKSVAPKGFPLRQSFAAAPPFIGRRIIGLMLVRFFPQLALWPSQLLN